MFEPVSGFRQIIIQLYFRDARLSTSPRQVFQRRLGHQIELIQGRYSPVLAAEVFSFSGGNVAVAGESCHLPLQIVIVLAGNQLPLFNPAARWQKPA